MVLPAAAAAAAAVLVLGCAGNPGPAADDEGASDVEGPASSSADALTSSGLPGPCWPVVDDGRGAADSANSWWCWPFSVAHTTSSAHARADQSKMAWPAPCRAWRQACRHRSLEQMRLHTVCNLMISTTGGSCMPEGTGRSCVYVAIGTVSIASTGCNPCRAAATQLLTRHGALESSGELAWWLCEAGQWAPVIAGVQQVRHVLRVWVGTACASQLHVSACYPYVWPATKRPLKCAT